VRRLIRFGLLWLCAGLVAFHAWAQDEPATRPLLFLGNAHLPPMVWNSNGLAEGIAVDLTYAAARKAGLDIQIVATDWAQAQADLREGKADALIQINPNPERLKVFDFSAPLLVSNFHIFRRSQDVGLGSLAALAGKRVGVEKGGFPFGYLQDFPQVNVVVVPNWARGLQMLQAGEIDAVFVDRWVGEYEMFLHKVPDIAIVEPAVVTLESKIAIRKGNPDLLAQINLGLSRIQADGTRQAIVDKWKAKEVVYLTRESISHVLLAALVGVVLAILAVAAWLYREHLRLKNANEALRVSVSEKTEAMQRAIEAQALAIKLSSEQQVVLDSPVIGILKVRDRVVQWTNRTLENMTGYSRDELRGSSTRMVYPSDADYESFGHSAYEALTQGRSYHGEQELVRKDGSRFYADISGALVPGDDGESIWCFSDITERHLQELKVHALAFHDVLTQLPNRALFTDRLTQALAASERSQKYGALIVLDLDNFKPLNDAHGHAAGDLLLKEVASRLKKSVREVDTVARFGGDEFAVIVGSLDASQDTSQELAMGIAENIRAEIAQPYSLRVPGANASAEAIEHQCTASLGLVLYIGSSTPMDELFRRADAAMYAAKAQGRNAVCFQDVGAA